MVPFHFDLALATTMNKPSDLIVAHKLCSICSDMCQHSQFLRCATRKSTFSLDEAEWFGHHTTRTELEECGATSCHLCQLFSEGPWDSELYLHKPPSIESIKLPPDTTPPARRSVDSWVGLTCFITLDEIEIYDYARGEKASSFKIATLSGRLHCPHQVVSLLSRGCRDSFRLCVVH